MHVKRDVHDPKGGDPKAEHYQADHIGMERKIPGYPANAAIVIVEVKKAVKASPKEQAICFYQREE
eukprot:m.314348 g.314348  ORF g.314348 m.314348 type:complete len:66 (+) comp520656_c0_seq1:252-449(+)